MEFPSTFEMVEPAFDEAQVADEEIQAAMDAFLMREPVAPGGLKSSVMDGDLPNLLGCGNENDIQADVPEGQKRKTSEPNNTKPAKLTKMDLSTVKKDIKKKDSKSRKSGKNLSILVGAKAGTSAASELEQAPEVRQFGEWLERVTTQEKAMGAEVERYDRLVKEAKRALAGLEKERDRLKVEHAREKKKLLDVGVMITKYFN